MNAPAMNAALPSAAHAPHPIARHMSRQDAAIARGLATPRRLPPIAGRPATTTQAPAGVPDPVTLQIGPAYAGARLILPLALMRDVLGTLDPMAPDAPPDWAALLLELALDSTLSAWAPRGADLGLRLAEPGDTAVTPYAIGVAIGSFVLRAELTREAALAVIDALRRLPPVIVRNPAIPVPLHPRIMAMSVTWAEMSAARAGDVFLPQARQGGEIWLVAGERFVWLAQRDGGRLKVISARRNAAADVEAWWMQDDDGPYDAGQNNAGQNNAGPDANGGDDATHGLGQLPIRLAFELGRLELTLAELEALGPGHVFELGRPDHDAVDILANGKRIGAGQLTMVGDVMGVQITRISGR